LLRKFKIKIELRKKGTKHSLGTGRYCLKLFGNLSIDKFSSVVLQFLTGFAAIYWIHHFEFLKTSND